MAKTRKREEVKKEDTWALEDLYASEQLFEEDCGRLAGMIEEFPKYKARRSPPLGEIGRAHV